MFEDSVGGLSIGAPVTFRGVRVGSVSKISLRYNPQNNVAYIPVEVSLEPSQVHIIHTDDTSSKQLDLHEVIARGLRAEQNLQSFVTGTLNINLDFFPGSPAELHPIVTTLPEIPTHASAMQKFKETLTDLPLKQLAVHADEAVVSIHEVAAKLNDRLPALATSLQDTSSDAQQLLKTATHTITDLQGKMSITLTDIDRLMRTSNSEMENRGAELHATLASATKATDQARKALESVQSILSPRSADRDNLDSALRDIAAAASSLRGFASDVERNPQLLLMGRRQ
ncbi:MlaD family protein [Acetobacter sp.]|uniref:MlaD family protein n=1 Tax=Acetobacter sp. TaxID=440 RepID=UPI0039EC8976